MTEHLFKKRTKQIKQIKFLRLKWEKIIASRSCNKWKILNVKTRVVISNQNLIHVRKKILLDPFQWLFWKLFFKNILVVRI